MESLFPSELSLGSRFSSPVTKTIGGGFTVEVSRSEGASELLISKLNDYVNRLQIEMDKIDGFKRELPLCMGLLRDEISRIKEELAKCQKPDAETPMLEEFIPLKKSCVDEKDDGGKVEGIKEKDISSREKMNWMSSVQLWNSDTNNQNPDTDFSNNNKLSLIPENKKKRKEEDVNRPVAVMDNVFRSGKIKTVKRAFVPFNGCASFPVMTVGKEGRDVLSVPKLSLCTPEIKNSMEAINSVGFIPKSSSSRVGSPSSTIVQSNMKTGQQQSSRKQRRCWSPELHRKFINALESLGGSQVATPKQIRDHMQVDGLTNDEVKSHLQKFRLHTRKSTSKHAGMWMSQEQQCGESSKQNNSQSRSPEGPLQLGGSSGGYSSEYEDDEKSESHTHLSVARNS